MSYRITGLSPAPFISLYGLSEAELAARGVIRYSVDKISGFPDRVEMRHAAPGETVMLLNHVCQPADTPYRATHAIFVREGATRAFDEVDTIPEVLRERLLSLRAYDAKGMMVDADVVDGGDVEDLIKRLLDNAEVSYVHAHNAKRGCYAGRIERA
jgi:Protein of unknown function (DUF1203)